MNPYSMDPSFNPPGIVSSSAIAPLMLRLWSLDCQWHIAAWHHLVLGVPRGSDLNLQNLFMTVGNSSIKNGIYTFIIYHISYYTYIYIIWYMYIWYELWKMRSSAFSSKDLVWWCVMFFFKKLFTHTLSWALWRFQSCRNPGPRWTHAGFGVLV